MIKLVGTHYIISGEALESVLGALEDHWFNFYTSNDDLKKAQEELEKEISESHGA